MKFFFTINIVVWGAFTTISYGQKDTSSPDISAYFYLDSVVVAASRTGLDVSDFIRLIREDQSFYKAFRNLRFVGYEAENDIQFFDKKGQKQAFHESKTSQHSNGRCREMDFLEKTESTGYRKKSGELRYYTSRMFERLFYTEKRVCSDPSKMSISEDASLHGMDKHVQELKKLIFRPGEKSDVPLIGEKTGIFDPDMMHFYDFSITAGHWSEGRECYIFTARVKDKYLHKRQNKTVIKYLRTYFEKGTLKVVGRDYQLSYSGWAFDFEVQMVIKLTLVSDRYLPEWIEYRGMWDIPAKKAERAVFKSKFFNYRIP